jgi:hypothetical protein
MRSLHRLAIGFVGLCLALTGGVTASLSGIDAAVAASTVNARGLQPNGTGFVLHSDSDQNFCLDDVPSPDNPASEASVSQCAVRSDQDWTFAAAADGSVVIVGGADGKCLDFSAKVSSPVSMTPCTFGTVEHFFYSTKGQIESTSGKKCLQATVAAQNAQVFIKSCKKDVPLQVWVLSR